MKDIKAILEGFDISDEDKAQIIDQVNQNYKTVEEIAKKNKRIEELEAANEELSEKVEEMPDTEEMEKLKEQVKEYKAAESKRKADEAEADKRKKFSDTFEAALEGKEFVNKFTYDSVFEKAYERCKADTGVSAADAIKEITEGDDSLFKNPQRDVAKMPSGKTISEGKSNDPDTQMREFASRLFSPKKE